MNDFITRIMRGFLWVMACVVIAGVQVWFWTMIFEAMQ